MRLDCSRAHSPSRPNSDRAYHFSELVISKQNELATEMD